MTPTRWCTRRKRARKRMQEVTLLGLLESDRRGAQACMVWRKREEMRETMQDLAWNLLPVDWQKGGSLEDEASMANPHRMRPPTPPPWIGPLAMQTSSPCSLIPIQVATFMPRFRILRPS